MKCEKCGGEWIPPKNISVSLTNCPFCGAPVLNAETAKGYTDMGEFLQYLVSLYGIELYNNQRKLNNLIADLYQGDERMKRVYRRAILDDSLSKRIYDLSKKPLDEREAYYNQIINQFSEVNFYTVDFGKQVIKSFVSGLQLEIIAPVSISTEATGEDGEWIDEFGVKYSADRKKLIEGNKSLETYKIKEGTVVICNYALWLERNLKSISIPNSVTSIGYGAFVYCESLTSITIPNSVTSIGDYAFVGCKSLTSIIIPNSVTGIGYGAFGGCESLTSITIPDSVTSIGDGAFNNCENLEITLESNKHFIIIDDVLYTSDIKKIVGCYSKYRDYVHVPNSVTSIGDRVFCGCKFLTSIVIPNSITNIGVNAFCGCKSLTSIVIPDSVTSIGGGAFWRCESLTSIVIPDSVTTISKDAFRECKSLTSIVIPDSVTSIGGGAFWRCESLTSIVIPDSVTSIGDCVFCGCKSLTSITIPNSVVTIGRDAFLECKSLTNIVIPDSVISIGNNAFWGCSSLTSITIPNSVTTIGNSVFGKCKSLRNIFIHKDKTEKFKKLLPENLHPLLKEGSEVD